MKRRMMAVLLCLITLCGLTGCQLAREGAEAAAQAGRLVGVLVTTEYLDLFDLDGYLEDNIGHLTGGELVIGGDTATYQGRIYARRVEDAVDEYVFDGVDGFPFFVVTVRDADGTDAAEAKGETKIPDVDPLDVSEEALRPDAGDSYTTTVTGPEISDVKLGRHISDTERRTTLEGTIYIAPDSGERAVYANPVYQDADGNVYVMANDGGLMVGGWTESEGEHYAETLEDAVTVTENGVRMTDSMTVTLAVSVLFAPEEVVVVEMDARNVSLARTEYAPGTLPEELGLGADVEYLVVETHKRDAAGAARVTRAIYGRDAEWMSTFVARADGIYAKRDTHLVWAD